MIIELSAGFDTYSSEQWLAEQHAIERLITAHANGWHLLSMTRKTAASILENCELSGLQKSVLADHIIPRLTNIVSQGRSLKFGVLCVPDELQITGVQNRVMLPLRYFANPDATLPAYIIVESIEGDGEFIRFLCGLMGSSLGFSSRSSLTFLAGGGGSTVNRYKEVADSGRATLCVVDSDSLYPNGPIGLTASLVVGAGVEQPLARVKVIPVRETENLIPFESLILVYGSNVGVRTHLLRIKAFVESKPGNQIVSETIYGHFDVKDGVKRSFIRRVDPSSQTIWKELWAHCNSKERDFDLDDIEADDVVIAPVSNRAIASTIEYFGRKPHDCRSFVRSVRSHPFREIVESLVSDVLSLTAAADRVRAPLRGA